MGVQALDADPRAADAAVGRGPGPARRQGGVALGGVARVGGRELGGVDLGLGAVDAAVGSRAGRPACAPARPPASSASASACRRRAAARCGSPAASRRRGGRRPRRRPAARGRAAPRRRLARQLNARRRLRNSRSSHSTARPASDGRDPLRHRRAGGLHQVDRLRRRALSMLARPRRPARPPARSTLGVGRLGRRVPPGSAGRRRRRAPSTRGSRRTASSSLADTSASTPRPNWATLPVIGQVGGDDDLRAVAVGLEGRGDRGVGVALAARLAALGPQHGTAGRVALDERRRALVLRGDGPDLHLDDAAVLVALDLLELGAGHARRDALEVGEHLPRPLDGHAHPELVGQLHAVRSSTVSTSALEPGHGTSVTTSASCSRARAPTSPVVGQPGPHLGGQADRMAAHAVVGRHRDRRRRRGRHPPPRLGGDAGLVAEPDDDGVVPGGRRRRRCRRRSDVAIPSAHRSLRTTRDAVGHRRGRPRPRRRTRRRARRPPRRRARGRPPAGRRSGASSLWVVPAEPAPRRPARQHDGATGRVTAARRGGRRRGGRCRRGRARGRRRRRGRWTSRPGRRRSPDTSTSPGAAASQSRHARDDVATDDVAAVALDLAGVDADAQLERRLGVRRRGTSPARPAGRRRRRPPAAPT